MEVKLPENNWSLLVNENIAGIDEIKKIEGNLINIKAKSAYVLISEW